jgi:hypothetical protein
MILNQRIIPLKDLEALAQKANEFSMRYDIPEEVYRNLIIEQESYYKFLENNPNCYGNKQDWEKAKVHNRFICLMLMIRISEIMESKYKTG